LPGRPNLQINIVAMKQDTICRCGPNSRTISHYGYTIGTSFNQDAVLLRDSAADTISVSTWELLKVGIAEKATVVSDIRAALSYLIDTFANNYLAENPK